MTDGRKQAVQQLCDDIEQSFDEVTAVAIDDASSNWESVALGVNVEAEAATYFVDGRSKDGCKITTNLRSFAPRLYNYIDAHETTLRLERPPVQQPTAVDDRDNVYDGNLYLLDIYLA